MNKWNNDVVDIDKNEENIVDNDEDDDSVCYCCANHFASGFFEVRDREKVDWDVV